MAIAVSFEATRRTLDAHSLQAAAELDMARLAPAYELLEVLCQQYVRDAMHIVHDGVVAAWHHKLLYAWCAKQSSPDRSATPSDVQTTHPDL
jgi:hypothetical protein